MRAPAQCRSIVLTVLHCNLRRSDLAWKKCFTDAGLNIIHEQVQKGFPEGLYPVKMCVPPLLSCDAISILAQECT